MKKNIALVVVLVMIGGAIGYLESMKVRPVAQDNSNGTAQTIAVPVEATSTAMMEHGTTTAIPSITLQSIARQDEKDGYPPAVEITDPTGFVNTPPLKLASLVGKKVVLLDFWTYSCINCIRTLPHLNALYAKYRDQGLEIVSIHTPEFEFEKKIDNIKAATVKYGIKYPVVVDSNYGTWQAYKNLYWPHEYLIDIAGHIVHDNIGEGGYDVTEAKIRALLIERGKVLGISTDALSSIPSGTTVGSNVTGVQSEETYFGSARNSFLANGTTGVDGDQTLKVPSDQKLNQLYLDGVWHFNQQYAVNKAASARILYRYHSKKLFFVAAAPAGATVEVLQDGKPVSTDAGADVKDGKVLIKGSRLYSIIDNQAGSGEHTLELIIDQPDLQAYTFTFG